MNYVQEYKSEFITQDAEESIPEFSARINARVNSIIKQGVGATPMCIPSLLPNGRKEVLLQWAETTDKEVIKPKSIFELSVQLSNKKSEDFYDMSNDWNLGWDACVKAMLEIFPEIESRDK